MQDRRYEDKEKSWTGGVQDRRDTGRWDAGEVGCRKGEMQESRDEEPEGFLTVGT